ncbi:hypothetical protein A9Q74_06140 [Colwellia sp. 39_35_sub15_T18]|nr:hypothetical protein A9Q74_06140 [Colwellia sp. 39_35_sub15_T18]
MIKWLEVLRQQVAESGQPKVAKMLGVSTACISQVVNEKYPGDMQRIEKLVEGAFLQRCVNCPVLGELALHECMQHQARKGISSNPLYMQLYKSCRSGCPHSSLTERLKRPVNIAFDATRTVKSYDYQSAVRRLTRQADGANSFATAQHLNELLISELEVLGIKYNRLIKGIGKKENNND